MSTFTLAVVQAAPVFLDRSATVARACDLIAEAARQGAQMVLFPEAFIPAYPDWVWAVPPGEGGLLGELYAHLLAQSVTIPGPAVGQICQAARHAGVYVAIGVNERNQDASNSSLYNTLLYIDAQGEILGRHRKLVPTGPERMVWTPGDGSTLAAYDTPFARVSGLICWENYMPLARYCLYAWGVQLYLAPTWDRGEPWLSSLRHIAREGGVYVAGCSIALRREDIPDDLAFKRHYGEEMPEWINGGDSAIVDPFGRVIAGPLHNEQGILYGEIQPERVQRARWHLDVAGHYARPDVFQLTLDTAPHPLLRHRAPGRDTEEPAAAPVAIQPQLDANAASVPD
ncbi:MAG: nitrilase [Litorilinea sp.]|nr:MAG: nitrilase [Litorilinea sp.]GIV77998.1 MAG: nitrilase [Litorilinea sp.]